MSFLLLAGCLLLGVAARRWASPPEGLVRALNWWVIRVALPALVLQLVATITVDHTAWFLVSTQWLVLAGSWLLFSQLGTRLGWSRGRIGAVVLTAGLGNTSFVGYPLLEALRGADGLRLGVIADQAGCFIALAVGGTAIASWYGGQRPDPRAILRKVLTFPAFVALIVAITVGALGGWPMVIDQVLSRIGGTLTPLALFSVGFQLRLRVDAPGALLAGLSWKLGLAPLLALSLGWTTRVGGLPLVIGVLQCAMAPMISAAILAEENDLDPPLANAILGVGILLSLLTVPLWDHFL